MVGKSSYIKLVLVIALLLTSISILAQDNPGEVPFEPLFVADNNINNLQWSTDGDILLFEEDVPSLEQEQVSSGLWYRVETTPLGRDIIQIAETQAIRLQNEETPSELITGIPSITNDRGNVGLVFPSPDGQYQAYPTPHPEFSGRSTVALVNVNTGESNLLVDIQVSILQTPRGYSIDWSNDSSAFTIRRVSTFAADDLYYVSNFSGNMTDTTVELLELFEIDGEGVGFSKSLTDLSSDGDTLIFHGFNENRSTGWIALANLTRDNSADNRWLHETTGFVRGITFDIDSNLALFIDGTGLHQIDLETGEAVTLDERINSTWISRAYFSPDGSQIAILGEISKSTGDQALYVIDVPQ